MNASVFIQAKARIGQLVTAMDQLPKGDAQRGVLMVAIRDSLAQMYWARRNYLTYGRESNDIPRRS